MTEQSPPVPPQTAIAGLGTWSMPRPNWAAIIVTSAIAVGAVLAILAAWRLFPFDSKIERTEDAYVQGHTTVIAPQVAGYVWRVRAEDFQRVKAGQILIEIDPRPFDQRMEQSRAGLDARIADLDNNRQKLDQALATVRERAAAIESAEAQRKKALLDAKRSADLVSDGSLSRRENDANVAALDEANAALLQAQAARDSALVAVRSVKVDQESLAANVEQARAALHSSEIDKGYTFIRSPTDGILSEVGVKLGQFASAGTPLMFMVPKQRWVIAYYKEKQTWWMQPGQRAWFSVDALGGSRLHGRVERIAPATAAQFSALQPENGTGNFTKVPQRIPVRISVDPDQPLAERITPGMSVEAYVDTSRINDRFGRHR